MTHIDPEVFDRAVEALEQRGWNQGSLEGADGSVCYSGALRIGFFGALRPVTYHQEFAATYLAARESLRVVNNDPYLHLPDWNDTPGRTKEEVIEHMKMMAKELRNEAAPE